MPWRAPVSITGGRKKGSRNRPRPNYWLPDELIEELTRASEAFAGEPVRSQVAAAHLVTSRCNTERYRHRYCRDSFYITTRRLDALFGKGQFEGFNECTGMFHVHSREDMDIHSDNVTHAYALTQWTLEAVETYRDSSKPTGFMDQHGRKLQTPRRLGVIPSRDKNGQRSARRIQIRHFVPINIRAVRTVRDQIEAKTITTKKELTSDDLSRISRQLGELARVANNTVVPGAIPQRYMEAASGRIYTNRDVIHLQNVKREVKRVALAGNWEYDFSNCQFTIFEQVTRKLGCKPEAIPQYLENKTEIRSGLARLLAVSVSDAKTLLIMILNGAQKPTRRSRKSDIFDVLQGDWAKVDRLFSDPFVRQLVRDRDRGATAILEQWPRSRGEYKNSSGKIYPANRRDSGSEHRRNNRILSHILQGAEARALNIACEPMGDELLLLQHDGFTVKQRVDVERIERDIANSELELRLTLEEEQLTAQI